jgi:hypothetical protein
MAVGTSLSWDSLTDSSKAAFEHAVGSMFARGPSETAKVAQRGLPMTGRVSTTMLLVGINHAHEGAGEDNPVRDLLAHFGRTVDDLNRVVMSAMDRRLTRFDPLTTHREPLKEFPTVTENTATALDIAAELKAQVPDAPTSLPLRFLFGGVLACTTGGAYRSLQQVLGADVDLAAIEQRYPEFLRRGPSLPFGAFLRDLGLDRGPGRSSVFAGNTSDATTGEDRLGRAPLVEDVARWLTAKDLQTPLAIGLFGDWGSGKSFFMRQLRDRIDELSEGSAAAEHEGRPTSFCSHVVQVSFNAWFHSDSEIWPSLAATVFKAVSGTRASLPGDGAVGENLRQRWVEQNPRFVDASRRHDAAEMDETKAREQAAKLTTEAEQLQERVVAGAEPLGDDVKQAVQGGLALRDIVSRWDTTKKSWKTLPSAAKFAIGLVALLTIVGVIALIVRPTTAAALTTAVAALGAIGGLAARSLTYVRQLFKDDAERQKRVQEAKAAGERARTAAARREAAATEMEELSAVGLLAAYATGQHSQWSERERLGDLSTIRRSFDQLSAIISHDRDTRSKLSVAPAGSDGSAIDRIVIYIDDLDRCQPELVVRVLESIKLLMDVPHFVVIVGVDSRWLFRSLEIRFRELFSAREEGRQDADGDGDGAGDWATTPQNYLEKIFQFSLMLPPMSKDGYERLIRSVFKTVAHQEETGSGSVSMEPKGSRSDGPDLPGGEGDVGSSHVGVTSGEVVVIESSSPPDLTPRDLLLTSSELDLLTALAPLIDTPRSAKRLTNVYRLLRVRIGEERLLEDDAFAPVLVLLGIVVGFPRWGGQLFEALMGQEPTVKWSAFVEKLRPEGAQAPFHNVATDRIRRADVQAWNRLRQELARLVPVLGPDRDVGDFQAWLPEVGSYTFHPWRASNPDRGTS